ncbi:TetR/AcrR family transcriptional regulator [Microbulbifer yueqingensis]|uniref:Transcriptional regulator, TetR family n=1 Tax=Microbulbifer yueqingensis TaxID=658219 RepID=A0A1G8UC73_9GAMM|nr:TetR/AcrR family transcriptional regulator [Microbulbifer yueqingensis]SDJ51357.1 transcriptional regulator, TetR family [Microbulbifer yueqingensis]
MSKVGKDEIIRAAEEVVREKGARKLTLDAVAAQCGLSKGGLLHHFRTKQALLQAMLESAVAREGGCAADYLARAGDGPGTALAARIHSMFSLMQDDESLPRSLIAAVAEDPALLEPIREKEERVRREICASVKDPELAQLLLFASRGMFFARVFGLMEPGDPQFERLRERLLAMAADID